MVFEDKIPQNQIKQQKKSEKVWNKKVSRRSFLKGLAAVTVVSKSKLKLS